MKNKAIILSFLLFILGSFSTSNIMAQEDESDTSVEVESMDYESQVPSDEEAIEYSESDEDSSEDM